MLRTASIPVSSLGRTLDQHGGYVIYPPVTGWPEVLDNSKMVIVVKLGMDTPPVVEISGGAVCAPAL